MVPTGGIIVANAKARRFPSERSSRRIGWTEGPAIVLSNGEGWHLPGVDDALVPYVGSLIGVATSLTTYLDMLDRGEIAPGDPAAEVANTYYQSFVVSLLKIQYRNRDRTIRELLRLDADRKRAAGVVIEGYLDAFAGFVARRAPVGYPSLASMN